VSIDIEALVNNITITNFGFDGCGGTWNHNEVGIWLGGGQVSSAPSVTVSHSNFNNFRAHIINYPSLNSIFEYNYFGGSWSSSINHGDYFQFASSTSVNTTMRYNMLRDSACQGITTVYTPYGGGVAINGLNFYGNVLVNMGACNGIFVSSDSTSHMANVNVYNNTFVDSVGAIFQCDSAAYCPAGANNVFENNLFVRGTGEFLLNGGTSPTVDYNAYYGITDTAPSQTHIFTGTGDPLVASKGGNYHLTSSVGAGVALSTPTGITVDPDGVTRGSDGVWDLGAYEFGSGSSAALTPPQGLQVTVK
jgi:hypothetical protein